MNQDNFKDLQSVKSPLTILTRFSVQVVGCLITNSTFYFWAQKSVFFIPVSPQIKNFLFHTRT